MGNKIGHIDLQQPCSAPALIDSCAGKTNPALRTHFEAMSNNNLLRLFAHSHGKLKEASRRAIQRDGRANPA